MRIEADVLSWGAGGGIYLIAILPAIRLAGVAVGRWAGAPDPAAAVMTDRYAALAGLSAIETRYRSGETRADLLTRQLEEVRRLAARYPASERIAYAAGNLELRLGLVADAERSLAECLRHPLCTPLTRTIALYDSACVAARCGRPEECRTLLAACLALDPSQRTNICDDPDFESVRNAEWFQQMARDATATAF